MQKITPIILAGGYGTRLWPVSRRAYPKQFAKIMEPTLFQQCVARLSGAKDCEFEPPIIITNNDFRFVVAEQMKEINKRYTAIIIEPSSKNTGPAVLAASLFVKQKDPNAILLFCPSDHLISDSNVFQKAVAKGAIEAEKGNLVTFGVEADRPETGFGYLEVESGYAKNVLKLKRFIEKPELEVAKKMFSKENFLWNSGIFLFNATEIVSAFSKFRYDLFKLVSVAVSSGAYDLNFLRLNEKSWDRCESISLDYAVMERAENIVAIKLNCNWSDLGDWASVWKETPSEKDGVVTSSNATAIDCKNVLLRAEEPNQHLVGLGLENIVAVSMSDAVLIARKDHSQQVRNVVSELKNKNVKQSENFSTEYRPWGYFEILAAIDNYQVKKIVVNANESLSLQSHKYRSEHWVVVGGVASVVLDKKSFELKVGESIYIPVGSVHRLENNGSEILIIIEVQTGTYLGEDDIVRYEDKYRRT